MSSDNNREQQDESDKRVSIQTPPPPMIRIIEDEEMMFANSDLLPPPTLARKKSLVRASSNVSISRRRLLRNASTNRVPMQAAAAAEEEGNPDDPESPDYVWYTPWRLFVRLVTIWLPDALIFGRRGKSQKQAFREKLALVFIIMVLCALVAFITVGMSPILCPSDSQKAKAAAFMARDPALCTNLPLIRGGAGPTSVKVPASNSSASISFVDWDQVAANPSFIVFNGIVMNLGAMASSRNATFPPAIASIVARRAGKDATLAFKKLGPDGFPWTACLSTNFRVASVDKDSPGCFASDTFAWIAVFTIAGVVITRLAMALTFDWFISKKLDDYEETTASTAESSLNRGSRSTSTLLPRQSRFSTYANYSYPTRGSSSTALSSSSLPSLQSPGNPFVVMMVSCYSEGEEGLRGTLESLANTDYDDMRKLIIVVADGKVTGSGNSQPTPEIVKDLMDLDPAMESAAKPCSYKAVASGQLQVNEAIVHVGHVVTQQGHRVPTLLIEKCGTENERTSGNFAKPGNRGKRDSQLILFNFFNRVLFDDRFSQLDFDLFNKISYLMGHTPEVFEHLLMVDADTVVYPDSLGRMVAAMKKDPLVMGLCGETRIQNKFDNFVTAMQVFEYYINHHLGKAFESVFGGVTCLPGCFCMYRIKAPKNGNWVPILVNTEVLDEYSQDRVDTLHQKNLLLLGEDRFLTTLMLKTFPKRKQIFVPRALCETQVPNSFSVLLSQRRRWINSTIHNLLELVLIRDLCGTFCFSMQFVIMLELIGSVVLPVAICLTFYLIANVIMAGAAVSNLAPLLLLIFILGSPALLIFFTNLRLQYLGWMAVYLVSLPFWNLILPIYAFWQFDNFSWGTTRKIDVIDGANKNNDSDGGGGHGSGTSLNHHNLPINIPMKKWIHWNKQSQQSSMAKRN